MQTWAEQSRDTLADLEQSAEARRKQHEAQRQPLRVKLQKVIDELPPERAEAGLSIEFFVEQTAPRGKGKYANPRDVGTALRAMGWTRTRKWSSEADGFRALWFPPTE